MTDRVKFLVEDVDEGIECVKEGAGDDRQYFIQGPFLLQEELNRNKRIYPRSQMGPAVGRYITEYVNRNRALGELNHPPTPTVNLDRTMLLTTLLEEDGNYWNGRAKLLTNTPKGQIAKTLLDEGIELGVSSRATAKVKKEKDHTRVTEGLRFHAIDMVADPSAHKAFVNMVMEDIDWVLDPTGNWQQVKEEIVAQGRKDNKALQANATKLFESFMASLGDKFKSHPDNTFLSNADRRMLNETTDEALREDRRAMLVRARKHLAGICEDRDAFDWLVRIRVLNEKVEPPKRLKLTEANKKAVRSIFLKEEDLHPDDIKHLTPHDHAIHQLLSDTTLDDHVPGDADAFRFVAVAGRKYMHNPQANPEHAEAYKILSDIYTNPTFKAMGVNLHSGYGGKN